MDHLIYLYEIIEMVEPLDIIGYPGHVLIVIDKNKVMESSPKKGVRILQIETRLKQLMVMYGGEH